MSPIDLIVESQSSLISIRSKFFRISTNVLLILVVQ